MHLFITPDCFNFSISQKILYDTCYVCICIFSTIHYIKICKIKLKTYKKEIMCYYNVLCFTFNGCGYM